MLDFEKEKMVKVAALKNLSNVLKMHGENQKMHGENQKQEHSAREQKDVQRHTNHCAEGGITLVGLAQLFLAHSLCSAPPYPLWDSQISACFDFSAGIVKNPHHSRAVRTRRQILPVFQPLPS